MNSAPETTLTATPAEAARSNVVAIGCTCSGGAVSRRSSPQGWGRHRSGLITPTPGSRNDSPTMPCSPERQPVPTAASPATVVDGNPACSVRPRSAAITGASSAWASRSSAAETVDQQHARAADFGGQIDRVVEAGHTHRRQHRWHHVGQMGSVRVRLWQVHIASLP